jgi:DTW domain-containing protein
MPHAVSRLRAAQWASHPPAAPGSDTHARCLGCRLAPSHCLCALRPTAPTQAGVCLLMAHKEPLKPSNTGWLIADVVPNTFAFAWARTEIDPALLTLLADPQWLPHVVFPEEYVAPERVVHQVQTASPEPGALAPRPLFILFDATWSEARKMFRKSPYLNHLPVLTLRPTHSSHYKLRRAYRSSHLCTSEVAALCLSLAGEHRAEETLSAYLDVFTHHYLSAKNQRPVVWGDAVHLRLQAAAERR